MLSWHGMILGVWGVLALESHWWSWRAKKNYGIWAGKDLYYDTPAVAHGFGLCCRIWLIYLHFTTNKGYWGPTLTWIPIQTGFMCTLLKMKAIIFIGSFQLIISHNIWIHGLILTRFKKKKMYWSWSLKQIYQCIFKYMYWIYLLCQSLIIHLLWLIFHWLAKR